MKLALFAFCVFLVLTPALAYRVRQWDNSKCSGEETSKMVYSNKKDLCQPIQSGSGWFKAKTECKNGQSVIVQRYGDGKCETPLGDPIDSQIVNGGMCISSKIGSYSSYMVDCSSASMTAPSVVLFLIAILALAFF